VRLNQCGVVGATAQNVGKQRSSFLCDRPPASPAHRTFISSKADAPCQTSLCDKEAGAPPSHLPGLPEHSGHNSSPHHNSLPPAASPSPSYPHPSSVSKRITFWRIAKSLDATDSKVCFLLTSASKSRAGFDRVTAYFFFYTLPLFSSSRACTPRRLGESLPFVALYFYLSNRRDSDDCYH